MQLILAAYTGSQVNSSLVIFATVVACFKRDRLRRIGKGSYATVWKGRDDRRLAARAWHRMTTLPQKKQELCMEPENDGFSKKEIPCLVFRGREKKRPSNNFFRVKPWWDQPTKPGSLKNGISRNHFGWIPGIRSCNSVPRFADVTINFDLTFGDVISGHLQKRNLTMVGSEENSIHIPI